MSKATDTHTTISDGTKEQLDQAEARYKQKPKPLLLITAIDEYLSDEPFGDFGAKIFDLVVQRFLLDWLHRPLAEIGRNEVIEVWSRLALRKRYDEARWFLQTIRALRNNAIHTHPEMDFGDDPSMFIAHFAVLEPHWEI